MQNLTFTNPALAAQLIQGAVGVLPTDTLYGLVASALVPDAVARVYEIKGRSDHKPCIILVEGIAAIRQFGVPEAEIAQVAKYWPGALSVVFTHIDQQFAYLRRELGNPPFRVPGDAALRELLHRTGPLIAPSANLQGIVPATTIEAAKNAFGERVDFYVDGGRREGEPSTLVSVEGCLLYTSPSPRD